MTWKFNPWLFVVAVLVVPVTFFLVISWYENNQQQLPVFAVNTNDQISFSLLNQRGEVVTNDSFKNKILVVDFFFSHCPSVCPKMTQNLKLVQNAFAGNSTLMINSFSIDPERDSVARLAKFASRFQVTGNWNFLTGKKEVIYRLARKTYMVDASEGDGGPEDFIHSDKLVLVDSHGRIRGFYNGTERSDAEQLIKDIKRLKKEKTKPD